MAPVCAKCKPDKPEKHSEVLSNSTGNKCAGQYKEVQVCMEKHKGNISDCKEVWDAFKNCHQVATNVRRSGLT